MKPDFSRLWFVSFADARMRAPLRRIRRQARRFGFPEDHILTGDENGLDRDFRERMRDRLVPGSRGFGFWSWKPQVILQALSRMPAGDILLYADAGCHLNPKGLDRFADFLEIVRRQGILGFQSRMVDRPADDLSGHYLREREWTKGDLLDFFNVRGNAAIVESGQIGATVILFRKEARTVDLVTRYRNLFLDHFELTDNTPSRSPDLPGFRENRHDQSVFSLLYKTAGYAETLSDSEYMSASRRYDADNPVHRALGRDFFDHPERRPVLRERDRAFGLRALIPHAWKPTLWKIVNWFKHCRF